MGLQLVILRQRLQFFLRQRRTIRIGFKNEVRPGLFWHRRKLLAIFLHQIRAPLDRVVHRKMLEVNEERPVLVTLDEIQRRIGQFVGVVVTFFRQELRIVSTPKRIVIGTDPPGDLLVETIGLRVHPQVGFTIVRGGVAMALEGFGQGHLLVRQSGQLFSVMKWLVVALRTTSQPLGQIGAGRVLARQDTGSARRTDVTGRVCIVEKDAFLGQLVDRRRFMELTAIAAHVRPTEIINKKKNNIGLRFFLRVKDETSKK